MVDFRKLRGELRTIANSNHYRYREYTYSPSERPAAETLWAFVQSSAFAPDLLNFPEDENRAAEVRKSLKEAFPDAKPHPDFQEPQHGPFLRSKLSSRSFREVGVTEAKTLLLRHLQEHGLSDARAQMEVVLETMAADATLFWFDESLDDQAIRYPFPCFDHFAELIAVGHDSLHTLVVAED